jgi:hypothetical protein
MDQRTRSDEMSVDARMVLAAWLRAGRDRRNLTIEDVAKITKIQVRILEKLESGSFDGLPAEVFVKGFVRSFAKCVGLDESEALNKYSAAQGQTPSITVAKALVDTMSASSSSVRRIQPRGSSPAIVLPPVEPPIEPSIEPQAIVEVAPVVETVPVEVAAEPVEVAAEPVVATPVESPIVDAIVAVQTTGKKKRSRKNAKQRAKNKKKQQELATAEPIESAVTSFEKQSIETGPVAKIDGESIAATSIEAKTSELLDVPAAAIAEAMAESQVAAVESPALAEGSGRISQVSIAVDVEQIAAAPTSETTDATTDPCDPSQATAGTWQPTMPPIVATTSVPWRRPNLPPTTTASTYVVPTLVIDDADPDSADREREDRIAKEPTRLSFLPPILLDREDRSARQGGLTLAVIILLIAATLTLSYLMRRPSPTGDGMTMLDDTSTLVG